MRFAVDQVALGEVNVPVFHFTAVSVIPVMLLTHISFMQETNKMPEPSSTTLPYFP